MADDRDPEHDEAPAIGDDADADESRIDDSDTVGPGLHVRVRALRARSRSRTGCAVSREGPEWTLPAIERCSAYLTPELPRQSDADRWLQQNFAELFARQLESGRGRGAWPATGRSKHSSPGSTSSSRRPSTTWRMPSFPRAPVTCAPLSLRQVLAEFLRLPPDGSLHVEIASGELFAWTDDELEAIHAGDARPRLPPDDMRELQDAFASESLVEIAHRADVDNLDTMVAFVATVESPAIRNRLMDAFEARKAGRRFKEASRSPGCVTAGPRGSSARRRTRSATSCRRGACRTWTIWRRRLSEIRPDARCEAAQSGCSPVARDRAVRRD